MEDRKNILWIIIAAGCLSAASALPFNLGPLIFGSAADSYGFTPEHIGYFSSLFLFAFSSSIIAVYFLQEKVSWHLLMVGGTLSGGVLMLLMTLTDSAMLWGILWLLVGLSFGPVFSIVVPVLAKLPNAARAFGGKLALETGIPALMLLLFPILVVRHWGYAGLAVGSFVALVILSCTARWIPKDLASPQAVADGEPGAGKITNRNRQILTWLGILVVCIYFGGQISVWIFVERSANSLNYGPEAVGILLALGKSGAMVGALAATAIANNLGRWKPHAMSFCIMVVAQLLLINHPSYLLFLLGAFMFEFSWAFLVPYLMAHVGELDETKKLVVFVPAAMAMGGAYGPALAGNIVTADDYTNVFIFGLCVAVICFAAYSFLTLYLNKIDRVKRSACCDNGLGAVSDENKD